MGKKKAVKLGINLGQYPNEGGGAPCIENRGIEDNFIFSIENCFFFVSVMKLR